MSDDLDDEPPEREAHETLLPSLHLSVLGGVSSIGGVQSSLGGAEALTPLPDMLSQPGIGTGPHGSATGVPVIVEEPGSKPRGAKPGDVVGGRYIVEGQLGRGGMGRVLRVRHQVLGKAFALKLIKTPIATDPRIREMFYREARLASALTHDNICSIVDFGQDPSFGLFMVMELLDGQTVHARLKSGRLAPKVACDIMWQVGDALRYIHGRAILHGDIKSENIFLVRSAASRRSVKLLDFGLARQDLGRGGGAVDGTPEYLAPERITGAPASTASDIYALGIVFWELLTGKLPFLGDLDTVFRAQIDDPVPALATVVDEAIDERADEIIGRATAKNPADRHSDVAAFLYELRTLMNMLGMEVGRRRSAGAEGSRERERGREVDHRAKAMGEVFQWSPLPMACVDQNGRVRVANQAFLEFIGVAGDAVDIQLKDSGFCEVCPTVLEDLKTVVARHAAIKRVIYLSEGGGSVVEAALVLTPPPSSTEVTAGEVHLALHPLRQLRG